MELEPFEYDSLIMNTTYDKFLQWKGADSFQSLRTFIQIKILCEYEVKSLSEDEWKCVGKNVSGNYHLWGSSVYYKKSDFISSNFRERMRVCYRSDCFANTEGHRAIINSKEEETFILEQIEDIFLEIGLSGYTSLENDDLSWDNNANGIPPEQLRWYYGKPRSSQPNCLAADSFETSDYRINWVAQQCNLRYESVCTFSPPRLRRDEMAVRIKASLGTVRNPYYGYFCLDQQRNSCYALLRKNMYEARKYIREYNFKVAVLKDEVAKIKFAQKIRPHPGVYVGATSMRLGDKYEWMYEQNVSFVNLNETFEEPNIENYMNRICLILASNGSFVAYGCNNELVTAIDVSNDANFDFVKLQCNP
ncbi:uncharacterized protein LOC142353140 [Convolutriloba macropyga]|uniref:uncharacterized protein LOC142353140 n=1 Tax=Convolutriloba macropyga TaxID=536237 RepID=UPI003F51CAB6